MRLSRRVSSSSWDSLARGSFLGSSSRMPAVTIRTERWKKPRIPIQALNATIRDIRSYIMNLKPARLTNENLIQSMRRLANDFYSNTFVPAEFRSEIEDIDRLSPEHVNVSSKIGRASCRERV